MPATRWEPIAEVSASVVEEELVLVSGASERARGGGSDARPRHIAILNSSGAALWSRAESGGAVTRPDSVEHRFFTSLAALGLVKGRDAPETQPLRAAADAPAPRILHTGALELLVYGATGDPGDKPGFSPTSNDVKWPFERPPDE